MADVNDKGDVSVQGECVGRLEGFRYSPDKDKEKGVHGGDLLAALAPHFHLRADRFYNAPDTEIDFTEQGGLMWGEHAVGKLVAGTAPLKPQVEVFVDAGAGDEVAQKVQRRLQHFIDRKIAALFEPLLNLERDAELSGPAREFADRVVAAMGIVVRGDVAQQVKDLDQDARGALRKHGVRFGQFTIFMPLLLKPAPTRLRLVLWSLAAGLQEFPQAPPPGLVTVPGRADAPDGYHAMCGYRAAGERAIRIDMLERLADMLRIQDSRAGFEATPDMLSITGMTLEQFADLMQGLGYRAEKGERAKVKPAPAPDAAAVAKNTAPEGEKETAQAPEGEKETAQAAPAIPEPAEAAAGAAPVAPEPAAATAIPEPAAATAIPEPAEVAPLGDGPVAKEAETGTSAPDGAVTGADTTPPQPDAAAEADGSAQPEAPETEVFYTFTWGRTRHGGARGGQQRSGAAPRGRGKPQAKPQGKPQGKQRGKPQGARQGDRPRQGAKTFSARPPRPEKQIDPDNPFAAALMGLKEGK